MPFTCYKQLVRPDSSSLSCYIEALVITALPLFLECSRAGSVCLPGIFRWSVSTGQRLCCGSVLWCIFGALVRLWLSLFWVRGRPPAQHDSPFRVHPIPSQHWSSPPASSPRQVDYKLPKQKSNKRPPRTVLSHPPAFVWLPVGTFLLLLFFVSRFRFLLFFFYFACYRYPARLEKAPRSSLVPWQLRRLGKVNSVTSHP